MGVSTGKVLTSETVSHLNPHPVLHHLSELLCRWSALLNSTKLWAKAAAPRSELGGQPRSYFVQQAYALLDYAPMLAVGTATGQETREIPEQLSNDHRRFLDVARQILNELWAVAS
jgi:hypothetical protein